MQQRVGDCRGLGQSQVSTQQGFSLIEIVIALLLISLASLGVVQLQTDLERQSDYVVQAMEALNLAENALERCEVVSEPGSIYQLTLDNRGITVNWQGRDQKTQHLHIATLFCEV